ncbi:PilW family protein [Pseudomonas tumuqii]|uniref:PilW family protein n=1 Tax=Pseudomonas tumuqii TaxID=2715755 RepID=UPI002115BDEF|nr:PilW family protein [Pseudomonas tumuqii]
MTRTSMHRQKGLSLVELLIAMTLSLLLMGGVLQIFLASKQTYSANTALSRVQESGRFAMEFLTSDIRNAGYKGECITPLNNLLNESSASYSDDLFDLSQALSGRANASPSWVANRSAGDVIHVKYAASLAGVTASGNTPATANTISLTAASGVAQGTIIIASAPLGCDLFQNRSNANAQNLTRGSTGSGSPGNKNPASNPFSHAYDAAMDILKLQSATYYIGNDVNSRPALRRISFSTGVAVDEVLIEGVENMQILYGIAGANKQVSNYVSAASVADWDDVVSVRVYLLVVGAETNVTPENQVIDFNGAAVTIGNRRLAQVFSSTIGIRNRLP